VNDDVEGTDPAAHGSTSGPSGPASDQSPPTAGASADDDAAAPGQQGGSGLVVDAGAAGSAAGAQAAGGWPGQGTDPRIDDAMSRLDELPRLPLTEQVEVFADIHSRLASVLSDPESRA